MKVFLVKVALFALLPLITFLVLDTCINVICRNKSLNVLIESKISHLEIDKNKTSIVIAGDSRAERQLIPSVIESVTGINTINIAVSNGELVSTVAAIRSHYHGSNFIFVISASSWQINDGAVDQGYLSEKCFQKISIFEKYFLFRKEPTDFVRMYVRLIQSTIKSLQDNKVDYDKSIIQTDGFNGVSGNFELLDGDSTINQYIQRHKFYKNLSNNGIRYKIFQESLEEIANTHSPVIIIQPPISPYGHKIIRNSIIEKAESEYSKKIGELIQSKSNVVYWDFFSNTLPELSDTMYYDYYHLNTNGANIFSHCVANRLQSALFESSFLDKTSFNFSN